MPKLSLNIKAIEERFDRIRREKAATRMAEVERKQVGLTRRTRLAEAGTMERLGVKEAGLGERLGIEEEGKGMRLATKETGLTARRSLADVAAQERVETQTGEGSPADIAAQAAKSRALTASDALSMEKERVGRETRAAEFSKGAEAELHKAGLGTFISVMDSAGRETRMFQPTERGESAFKSLLLEGEKDPGSALEILKGDIQIIKDEEAELERFNKLTPEQQDKEIADIQRLELLKKRLAEKPDIQKRRLSILANFQRRIKPKRAIGEPIDFRKIARDFGD